MHREEEAEEEEEVDNLSEKYKSAQEASKFTLKGLRMDYSFTARPHSSQQHRLVCTTLPKKTRHKRANEFENAATTIGLSNLTVEFFHASVKHWSEALPQPGDFFGRNIQGKSRNMPDRSYVRVLGEFIR